MLDAIRSLLNLPGPLVLRCPWCHDTDKTLLGRAYGAVFNLVATGWWMFEAPRPHIWRIGAWNHYAKHVESEFDAFDGPTPTFRAYYKAERQRNLASKKIIRARKKAA